jgi:group I intron endonuclease
MSQANKGINNPMYGKSHSIETLIKMSEAMTGINNPNFGKPISAEIKAKISEAHKGKTHTAEAKAKMSIAKGNTIYVYEIHGSLVNTFCSTREAGKYYDCPHSTDIMYLRINNPNLVVKHLQ